MRPSWCSMNATIRQQIVQLTISEHSGVTQQGVSGRMNYLVHYLPAHEVRCLGNISASRNQARARAPRRQIEYHCRFPRRDETPLTHDLTAAAFAPVND